VKIVKENLKIGGKKWELGNRNLELRIWKWEFGNGNLETASEIGTYILET